MQDHRSRIHHDRVRADHGEGNTSSLCYIGYGATFVDFIAQSRDRNDVRPDGASVVIDPSAKSIAEQIWDLARSVTTYAKNLMRPVLQTLGVS